ncbi:MAG: PaaI family thioesterase [Gemmatimonadota bacterium]|nr:PaaI family thioesterase [Gemmatimonadota bacterium]
MSTLTPSDPEFRTRVHSSFASQRHMATLSATLDEVEPGRVAIRLPYSESFTQQNGFMHAGAIASVADSACGYAAYTLVPPTVNVLTVEYKVNLIAPARGVAFIARAEVLRAGRTLTICRADVIALAADGDANGQMVATMLATIMAVAPTHR